MQNDPELNPKQLGELTENFVKVAEHLKEASYQLRARKISEYPIFVWSKEPSAIGQPIVEKGAMGQEYFINFSFLSEFEQRQLVSKENLPAFMQSYKDPDEFACLFVVLPDFINFVYIPYPEDSVNE